MGKKKKRKRKKLVKAIESLFRDLDLMSSTDPKERAKGMETYEKLRAAGENGDKKMLALVNKIIDMQENANN